MTTQITDFATAARKALANKPQESIFNALLHLVVSQEKVLAYMGRFRVCDLTKAPHMVLATGYALGELTRATLEFGIKKAFSTDLLKGYVGKKGKIGEKDTWKYNGLSALLLVTLLGLFGYAVQRSLSQTSLSLDGRVYFRGDVFANSFYLAAVSHGAGYVVRVIYAESTKKIKEWTKQEKEHEVSISIPQILSDNIAGAFGVVKEHKGDAILGALTEDKTGVRQAFLEAALKGMDRQHFSKVLEYFAQIPTFTPFVIACFANEETRATLTGVAIPFVYSAGLREHFKLHQFYVAEYKKTGLIAEALKAKMSKAQQVEGKMGQTYAEFLKVEKA